MSAESIVEGAAVEYVGAGDGDMEVFVGHPGRVVLLHGDEAVVSWVNGPSWDCSVDGLRLISERTYLTRGDRLVALLHPLRDEAVPRFNAVGDEWPDGARPQE